MKSLMLPKEFCTVTFALGLVTMAAACGQHTLHTGATTRPVAPPIPVPVHADGTCDPGLDPCQGQGAGFCFDLQSSPNHCGTCGNACPLGTPCENGQCRIVPCTSQISVQTMRVDYNFGSQYQIALADFDRDGSLDMIAPTPPAKSATPDDMYKTASVFRGNGDGTFVMSASYPAEVVAAGSNGGFAVVTADLNQDQIPDLVTRALPSSVSLTSDGAATIVARLGNGDGTFGPEIGLAAGAEPSSIAVADLDGDGKLDLANIAEQGSRLSVYHGNGDGTFSNRQDLVVGGTPRTVTVTDWNGDGIADLLVSDAYIHLLLGTGNGQFAQAIDCGLSLAPLNLADLPVIADFDRDGIVDLVSNNTVLFGMHECNFTRQATYHVSYNTAYPLAAGDFNGDGATDLAFASWDGIGFLPGDGHGNFGAVVRLGDLDSLVENSSIQPDMTSAVAADVNGDGRLDLVVANQISIRVFLNTCK
jgi:hypothetical protein